jgi:hypothetical protein
VFVVAFFLPPLIFGDDAFFALLTLGADALFAIFDFATGNAAAVVPATAGASGAPSAMGEEVLADALLPESAALLFARSRAIIPFFATSLVKTWVGATFVTLVFLGAAAVLTVATLFVRAAVALLAEAILDALVEALPLLDALVEALPLLDALVEAPTLRLDLAEALTLRTPPFDDEALWPRVDLPAATLPPVLFFTWVVETFFFVGAACDGACADKVRAVASANPPMMTLRLSPPLFSFL